MPISSQTHVLIGGFGEFGNPQHRAEFWHRSPGEVMSDTPKEQSEATQSHFEAPHPPRVNPSWLVATVLLAVLLLCIAIFGPSRAWSEVLSLLRLIGMTATL